MGIGAFVLLIVGAAVVGFAYQAIGTPRFTYDWLIAGIGAGVGAFVAGQSLGPATTWGPVFDGLYVLPALLGGLALGGVVEYVVRLSGQGASST